VAVERCKLQVIAMNGDESEGTAQVPKEMGHGECEEEAEGIHVGILGRM
jgi:hypothetical protein